MNGIALVVYTLCAVTSAACAWLLFRGYRRSHLRLLFWSSLCFAFFFLNNALLILDADLPAHDLSIVRTLPSLVGIALLIWGLAWDSRR